MAQYRQGDVFLERVAELPAGAARVPGPVVLARGEQTGHAHVVKHRLAAYFADGDARYLRVRTRARVTHEEHDPVTLPAGVYRVTIQREYTPEAIRQVSD